MLPLRSVLLAPLFACACATPKGPASAPDAYTLVVLTTGPRTEPLTPEQRNAVFAGHFANMERLAGERCLLLAGPFGKTKHDPSLRGLFVLDTADRERARQLAESDPGYQAGVFALRYHALSTAAPLRAQLEADLAAALAIRQSGREPSPGEGGRGYVLLTCEDGETAQRELGGHPALLLLARLDSARALALLDASDCADASTKLAEVLPRLGAHSLDDWFGSGLLAGLPARPHVRRPAR